jgi:hypothetical protein
MRSAPLQLIAITGASSMWNCAMVATVLPKPFRKAYCFGGKFHTRRDLMQDGSSDPEDSEMTFTTQETVLAQTALRGALNLPPAQFPLRAFIGMLSDEIEQLRASGQDDVAIAMVISKALGIGKRVDAEDIARFYATAEARGHK